MDQALKDFVIAHYEKMSPDQLCIFLRGLRSAPSLQTRLITNCIEGWKIDCEIATKQEISVDFSNDPQELLEALKVRFAKELAEITR